MRSALWLTVAAALAGCGGTSTASPSREGTNTTVASSGSESPAGATTTTPSNATAQSTPSASQGTTGEAPPEIPSQDPSRWLNGQPFTLAASRGAHVVLIESWHRL